jgi:hypothetical protein
VLVGLALIAVGLIQYNNADIPASYVNTYGTVTSSISRVTYSKYGGETYYYPVVKFQVDNTTYTFTSSMGQLYEAAYTAGSSIAVAYNPIKPSSSPKVATTDAKDTTKVAIGFFATGAIVLLGGLVLIFRIFLRK